VRLYVNALFSVKVDPVVLDWAIRWGAMPGSPQARKVTCPDEAYVPTDLEPRDIPQLYQSSQSSDLVMIDDEDEKFDDPQSDFLISQVDEASMILDKMDEFDDPLFDELISSFDETSISSYTKEEFSSPEFDDIIASVDESTWS
jgi:hypothetical protein